MAETITRLPNEMIVIILGYNDITIEDVINFRCVCKKFRYAAKYDKFWEKKLFLRWSSLKEFYDKQFKEKERINFIETGRNCMKILQTYFSQIMFQNYYDYKSYDINYKKSIENVINFDPGLSLNKNWKSDYVEKNNKSKDSLKCLFFADEITHLFSQYPRKSYCDLIEKYCNIETLHYVKLCSVKNELDKFVKKPEREQILEQTFTFVAQYIQPEKNVCYSSVQASLDNIAQEVLDNLKGKHPNNSIFSTACETFSYWKNNNIYDNYWDEEESTQIMDALQEYMFGNLNFRPCSSSDLYFKYLCIDYVLQSKCGDKRILATIYHSVARRLGLRCDVIDDPLNCHYCIFWKPKHFKYDLEYARCFDITLKKFPDCLVNQLSGLNSLYSWRPYYKIKTRKIWDEIRTFIIDLIRNHLISRSGLIRVNLESNLWVITIGNNSNRINNNSNRINNNDNPIKRFRFY